MDALLDSYFQITPSDISNMFHTNNYSLEQLEQLLRVNINIGIDTKDQQDIEQRKKQFGINKIPIISKKSVWQIFSNKCFQLLLILTILENIIVYIETQQCTQSGLVILLIVFLSLLNVFKVDNFSLIRQNKKQYQVLRNSKIITIPSESVLVGDVIELNQNEFTDFDGVLIENPIRCIESGTKIQGNGKLLVLAIGENTTLYKNQLLAHELQTPLQERLDFLQQQLNETSYYIPFFTFLSLCTHYSYGLFIYGFPETFIIDIIEYFQIALLLSVVLIKQDLPLLISSYLYYNFNRMKKNKFQFLRPSSCEILGRVNNIITSKTGTLTDGQLKVTKIYSESQDSNIKNLNYETIQLISENICLNSTACPKISLGKITVFEKIGNETECALLQYCFEIGMDFRQIRSSFPIIKQKSFTSESKVMSTLIKHQKSLRLYIKGAPEIIIELCSFCVGQKGLIEILNKEGKQQLKEVAEVYCSSGLRTICLAYGDDKQEKELTFISLIGLEDNLRQGVKKSIQYCKEGGVIVKMVTNDHLHTAVSIAKQCGILPQNYEYKKDDLKVLTGTVFRELVKGVRYKFEDGIKVPKVGDLEQFESIAAQLRVLARSTNDDKLALIAGLRELNYVVGSFSKEKDNLSDVVFSVGQSGSVCILDNNFASLIYSLDWGRNVFNVSRKYIQFTLTHLISFTTISVLCSLLFTKFPFSQFEIVKATMLINTFAFFAYSTDIPNQILMERQKHERHYLITSNMWRNIISQTIYQILIILLIGTSNQQIFRNSDCSSKNVSFFFTTFIYLQIVNLIISHKLLKNEFILSNKMSVNLKIGIEITILLGFLYPYSEHLISVIFALPAFLFVYLFKYIPDSLFEKITLFRQQEKRNRYSTLNEFLQYKSHAHLNKSSRLKIDPEIELSIRNL